ncbi:hypothetical protein BDF14DRAFT_1744861 [Spinellus fusiger]|nr:hypothetical protein BDF14DRAFT_1744861 [Spinellus fusiger]
MSTETKNTKKKTPADSATATATLFVRGLPPHATSKDLETFFGDVGPTRKCFVVADTSGDRKKEGEAGFKNRGFGYVHYALAEDATLALTKLKSLPFMGLKKLRMELAKRKSDTTERTERTDRKKTVDTVDTADTTDTADTADTTDTTDTEQKNTVGEKRKRTQTQKPVAKKIKTQETSTETRAVGGKDDFLKAARLIVRNLPWKYREADLQQLFEAHGKVMQVTLPRKFEGGPLRGFAFIQYETVAEATTAIEALNASEHVGRTIAVDWALAKDRFKKLEGEEEKTAVKAAAPAKEDVEMKEEEENEDSDDSEEKDSKDSEDSDEEKDSEDSDDPSSSDKQETIPAKKERTLPQVSEGTTLFVRNLLFETTEEDLKGLFLQWGRVRYARITRDPETRLSRGSGFVCMLTKEDADTCLEESEQLKKMAQKEETDDQSAINALMSKREKKKKGTLHKSLLAPDGGSGLGQRFTLHGRVLDVTRAVDRTQASKIKEDKLSLKKKEDKRHLYLMREGVIFPNTPASETISPAELQKRQMAFSNRRKQVSSNPSLFISKTRLSVRNLPLNVGDVELKKIGVQSIQKFKEQVKTKARMDLSKEEKEEGWQYMPRVKQAKIIRSTDRVDVASQQGRSKGYGFLEYTTHSHALAALRYLNNNPDIFQGKRLTVEFSLENSLRLKKE